MIALFAIVVSIWLFYQYLWKPQLYWRKKNVRQGTPIPILGDGVKTMFHRESVTEFVLKTYKNYKGSRYCGIYQAIVPTLVVLDPKLIKQIAVKDFDHFVDHHNFGMKNDEPVWNKNLLALRGTQWRDMRATLSPTFTSSKMRLMFELLEKSAGQYVDFYAQQNKPLVELELKDSFTRVANDIIASCAFGATVDSLKDPMNDFYMNGLEVTNFSGFWTGMKFLLMMFLPSLSKQLKLTIFRAENMDFFRTLVRDSVRVREEQNIVRPDMINILMEARRGKLDFEESAEKQTDSGFATVEESDVGKTTHNRQIAITEEDMAAQVLIFFFAGFDTVSTVLAFTCYELALNADVQGRLSDEINKSHSTTGGKLTYEVLHSLKYLDMVICESLRKHPPGVVLDRMCTKAYTIPPERVEESAVELPIGQSVWFPVIGIHHDEDHYPNPEKFEPERFSEENRQKIQPYTFIPFGVGPRNCIGCRFALMEVKTLLYHILRKFEIVVVGRTQIPLKYDTKIFNPAIAGGCWVGYKRRL